MSRRRSAETPEKKRSVFALVSQAGALVALIGGVVTLVFVFKPGWKPKEVDVGTATITDVRVLQPVTFKRYLQEQELSTGTLAREQAQARRDGLVPLRARRVSWAEHPAALGAEQRQDERARRPGSGGDDHALDERRRARLVRVGPEADGAPPLLRHLTLYQPQKQRVPLKRFDTPPFTGG